MLNNRLSPGDAPSTRTLKKIENALVPPLKIARMQERFIPVLEQITRDYALYEKGNIKELFAS